MAAIKVEAPKIEGNVQALAEAITCVFAAAHDHRMDQETVRAALDIIQKGATQGPTNITSCNFQGARY
ncbi:MAG: hypothetical protein ACXVGC_12220 [Mycobacteriaceae bacterium]